LEMLAPEYAVSLLDGDGGRPRQYICERLQCSQPSAEHEILAVALGRGACVYTPNFDTLIEKAAGTNIDTAIRRSNDDDPGDARYLKLHGSCPDIIVSAEEVMLSITGPWADRFLNDCRAEDSHLVVWGYRGADPDLAPLVRAGVELAHQCTWIAFSQSDAQRVFEVVGSLNNVEVVCANSETLESRRIAASVLDPLATVDIHRVELPREEPPQYSYSIQSSATRAQALSHLGGSTIGRIAWWFALVSGDRSAVKQLSRSYLFDFRLVQAVALSTVTPLLSQRPSRSRWNVVLTAAEGRGSRANDDRLIQLFQSNFGDGMEGLGRSDTEVTAKAISMMRRRGRLHDALKTLDSLEDLVRSRDEDLSATWSGRLIYERAIILRMIGEIQLAQSLLNRFDTENVAIVGANWSMWLEDEKCAHSIWSEDAIEAKRHLNRARELARAYGSHRLARVDLEVRNLQIQNVEGCSSRKVFAAARKLEVQAVRLGVLTPMRRAWINGIRADALRRNGEITLAPRYYGRLRRSPDLMNHLAATVGELACGLSIAGHSVPNLVSQTGRTSTSAVIENLVSGSTPLNREVALWIERLGSNHGFAFIS
jgi:hypothetical protein